MFPTIARLRRKGGEMKKSNNRNGVEHVPTCSTWPPPWLTEEHQPAGKRAASSTLPPSTPPARPVAAPEAKQTPATDPPAGDWQEWVCRAIEAEQGLSAGGIRLHPLSDVCPGCEFCQAKGKAHESP